jgi:hypothetical protein
VPILAICRANGDDFDFADGVIDPPNDGVRAENGNLPVAFICSSGREVALY